jgi:hypothetical protein
MENKEVLESLKKDIDDIKERVKDFLHLNEFQLNWKESEKKWSIGQCFSHLNLASKYYLDKFDHQYPEASKNGTHDFKSGRIGGYLIRFVMDPTKRTKSPLVFAPSKEHLTQNVIKNFNDFQQRWENVMAKSHDLDLINNKIQSPLSRFVKLRLGDVFLLNLKHEIRHLKQARNILISNGFPVSNF